MLLMLGGAPRAGKGIISRQLVRKTAMPFLSLDMLKMGLHHAVPSMGVDPSAPSVEVAEKMWPLVRAMAENALESNLECIFEWATGWPLRVERRSKASYVAVIILAGLDIFRRFPCRSYS